MQSVRLEVAVDHPDAAIAASRGGAERLELCSSLADGGLTPSIGFVEWAVASLNIQVHCMIRPRAGDFCYNESDLTVMEHDIRAIKSTGAHGVVLGVLTAEREVDVFATRRLVQAAHPLCVVFHRAFDLVVDLSRGLEDVIDSGVSILLTSGGLPSLGDGRLHVAKLIEQAGKRIQIMGGAGVRLENAAQLWDELRIDTIHASLRRAGETFEEAGLSGAEIGSRNSTRRYTLSEEDVHKVIAMLKPRVGVE